MGTAIMDNLQRDREVMTRTRERVIMDIEGFKIEFKMRVF